ncbi:hypothetical protein C21_03825 [Arenibacter sp. NBRC 103722]|uniref:YkvA family protein n=1 Tax=Arenibacter sp. NBRC 103722 TaxID=1113929 RepID=UPI0008531ECD|nr:DUF1232 domain-containing protein [Arenibacter sp. NBRC 103722]GBF21639.1 hypothetical protein C21_03825 [Arenibacter sp. NBRC 103722]|tara:strand:- start:1217 stop:1603 length:387 start_codon:yes stop_codon:yes gene_type:complete
MSILKTIKHRAKKLKQDLVVLHLAYGHPKTPWTAKAFIVFVISYALSPIDLIPDFIPVLGLLDDIILLPLGIYWAFRLIPKEVFAESLIQAKTYQWNKKKNVVVGLIIALIWIAIAFIIINKIAQNKK